MEKQCIDQLVLEYGNRGMNLLCPFLPERGYEKAAEKLERLERGNVFIATGFYVKGNGETDGPLGAFVLAHTLREMGFSPFILTDRYAFYYFHGEIAGFGFQLSHTREENNESFLKKYAPVAMISVERCGKNREGIYANMRGVDIGKLTAPIDELFELGSKMGILTIGIGDGGNEIGMGVLEKEIKEYLSLSPCIVKTDHLLIASVSNWGAYGLSRMLELITGESLMPDIKEWKAFFSKIVKHGAVDGVTGENGMTVDGFPPGREEEMYKRIMEFKQK